MTIEYEFTLDDLTALNLYHCLHAPSARRHYFRSWLITGVVLLLGFTILWYYADLDRGTPLQTFVDMLPLFCVVPLILILFPFWYRRGIRRTVAEMADRAREAGLFTRHQISLSPEGLMEAGKFGTLTTAWPTVTRIVPTRDHAFVYINGMASMVIPRRAFAEPAEFAAFLQTAESCRQQAIVSAKSAHQ